MKCFIFLLFYNALDLNNQKILCLPSIYQFERTGTNLNHPKGDRSYMEEVGKLIKINHCLNMTSPSYLAMRPNSRTISNSKVGSPVTNRQRRNIQLSNHHKTTTKWGEGVKNCQF